MLGLSCLRKVVPHLDRALNCDRVNTNATDVWCLWHDELAIVCIVDSPERHIYDRGRLHIATLIGLVFEYIRALCHAVFGNPINYVWHGLSCLIIIHRAWCNSQHEILFGRCYNASIWGRIAVEWFCNILVCHHRDWVLTDVVKPSSDERS